MSINTNNNEMPYKQHRKQISEKTREALLALLDIFFADSPNQPKPNISHTSKHLLNYFYNMGIKISRSTLTQALQTGTQIGLLKIRIYKKHYWDFKKNKTLFKGKRFIRLSTESRMLLETLYTTNFSSYSYSSFKYTLSSFLDNLLNLHYRRITSDYVPTFHPEITPFLPQITYTPTNLKEDFKTTKDIQIEMAKTLYRKLHPIKQTVTPPSMRTSGLFSIGNILLSRLNSSPP